MKKLRSLYLLASDEGFRLVHTHDPDLAEIAPGNDAHGIAVSEGSGSDAKVEQERARLAHHAVEALQKVWAKGTHDRIILAAGPKTLGHLRHAMPKALQAHVVAELHKDLMKTQVHDLSSHFKEVAEA